MFRVDPSLSFVQAAREQVLFLEASVTEPLVNIPGHGTAPTEANVLGILNADNTRSVYVFLHQPERKSSVVYVSEPRKLGAEAAEAARGQASSFVASMGFTMEDSDFAEMSPEEQSAWMDRAPVFRGPMRTADIDGRDAEQASQSESISNDLESIFDDMRADANEAAASESPTERVDMAALGRLLGTFCFLLFAMVGACRTSGPAAGGRATDSFLDLGNQQLAERQWSEAIRAFKKVTERDDQSSDAYRGLGLAYMNLGRLGEAEAAYRKALALNEKFSIARNELAVLLIQAERCEEAEASLRVVLGDIFYSTPEFAEHNLARALECQGRTTEALKILDALLVRRPKFCLGYLSMAALAETEDKPERVLWACEHFFSECQGDERISTLVRPEHLAQCSLRQGVAHLRLGDVESARSSFLRCAGSGPLGAQCRASLQELPR